MKCLFFQTECDLTLLYSSQNVSKKTGKVIPLQARCGPEGG